MGVGRKHTKLNNRKGFTLVELIVVIVITMILAGGITMGVVRWIRNMHFNEQEEYASVLYLSAQNQLAKYSAGGRMGELQSILKQGREDYPTSMRVPTEGATESERALSLIPTYAKEETERYLLKELWPESKDKEHADDYRDEVCYIMGTVQTYDLYQKAKAGQTLSEAEKELLTAPVRLLYDILLPYLYDPTILKATVCLEFAPSTGQIFSVLYSNDGQNQKMTYGKEDQYADKDGKAGNSSFEGVVSIFDRRYKERYKRNLGYYGVDSMTKVAATSAKKPVINKLKLNNEDTLNLSFQLANVLPASMGTLDYKVEVLDYKSDVKRLDIAFSGAQLTESKNTDTDVLCTITRYDENGNTLDTRADYPLTISGDGTSIVMYLDRADRDALGYDYDVAKNVLNGAGIESVVSNDEKTYALKFIKTYSFHRFGIDEKQIAITGNDYEDVYCAVSVSGAGYKESSRKKSNHENPYFAKKNQSGADVTSQIANGRHLYNIRFEEDSKTAPVGRAVPTKVAYELINDIDWGTFAVVEPKVDGTFVSIKQLAEGSTFTSKRKLLSSENYVISGLNISEVENGKAAVYGKEITGNITEGPVGLFVRNYGIIDGVGLDRIKVFGKEAVGAFCGENAGTLQNLTVLNTDEMSKITGDSFVGGIFGQDKALSEVNYNKLNNSAKVEGRLYVGGITGRVETKGKTHSIQFTNCKNTGAITTKEKTARFLGGIVGLVYQAEGEIRLENCISSPHFSDEELKAMGLFQTAGEPEEADTEKLNKYLLGSFVGGIVGYNHDGILTNCSTKTEAGKDGYVIGDSFVGGIVGLNESDTTTAKLSGGASGVNEAHVFGDSYVGGIAGANADLTEKILTENGDNMPEVVPVVSHTVNAVEVEKWINRGIVSAKSNYAGGIVGFNTGHVYECRNEVISKGISQSISKAQSMSGSFVGGIVGYNNGEVNSKATKDVSTISYVTGRNYVGGIVGYNDFAAKVAGYKLGGGSVKGSGAFVGGFAGFNASAELLDNQSLLSSPNQVTGKYFVGGSIGGNILVAERDIEVELNTDNFLGNMEGDAFTGGIIGYNQFILVKSGEDKSNAIGSLAEKLAALTDAGLADYEALSSSEKIEETAFQESGKTVTDEQKLLYYVLKEVNKLSAYDAENRTLVSPKKMSIKVLNSGSDLQNKLGGVTGKIYVGGVIGYNAEKTGLYLKNIVNRTPITATLAIPNGSESPSEEAKYKTFVYSYVGGVVGKVGPNTIVENCYNSEVGDVSGKGTYLGSVCEINEGQVINCAVSNIGFGGRDYVGGLVGLNKKNAKIIGARFENKSVIGESFVGGIVSENYGEMELLTKYDAVQIGKVTGASVRGQGDAVGGICAVNYGRLTMVGGDLAESVRNADILISGNGTRVGGVVGVNNGDLKAHATDSVKFTLTGTVSGKMIAGGVVGENQNQTVQNFVNKALVSTVSGASGGIAGTSKGNIFTCENMGQVEATKEGNAGGIVAKNEHVISACINHGEVTSKRGNCGGIAAENTGNGDIINCLVSGTTDKPLKFVGYQKAGAVCAENAGRIRNLAGRTGAYVEHVIVTNNSESKSRDCSVGLIAGVNTGKIGDENPILVTDGQVVVETEGIIAGGLVGSNLESGTLRQVALTNAIMYMSGYDQKATTVANQYKNCKVPYANMGGAVGINGKNASVENCAIHANIYGYKGFGNYAYGGLTAKNEGKLIGDTFNGSVICNGDAANNVIIGGFAGTNSASGVIDSCYFGNEGDQTVTYRIETGNSATGIIGGMIGENYGKLTNADHSNFLANVLITNQQGHTGGAVGFLHEGGVVSGSDKEHRLTTGPNWEILNKTYGNDTGVAGICGYSNSGEEMRFVANYAKVTGTNEYNAAAGGIMGRWENRLVPGATCYQLENYGEITGGLAGGIIGRVKFMYPQILECVNYGRICTISAKDNGYAGGIVASFHNSATKQVVISKCINYGEITENSSTAISIGGIVGYAHDYSLRFVECSNLGNLIIKTKPTATNHNVAGILANKNVKTQKDISIQFCTNYGNSNYSGFYGICAKADQESEAIANDFSAGAYVTYNADGTVQKVVNNPVNNYTKLNNWNVFFMRPRELRMNEVAVNYGSSGKLIEESRSADKLNVKSEDKTLENTFGVQFGNQGGEKSITFKMDTDGENAGTSYSAYNLSKLKIRFARPEELKTIADILNVKRVYHYKIRMVDGNGTVYWLGNSDDGKNHGWYGSHWPSNVDGQSVSVEEIQKYAEDKAYVFTTTLDYGEFFKDTTLDFTGGKTNIELKKIDKTNIWGRTEKETVISKWNTCDWTGGIREISIVFTEINRGIIWGILGDDEKQSVAIDYLEGAFWDGTTAQIMLKDLTTDYVDHKVFPLRSSLSGDVWDVAQGSYDWKLKYDQTGNGVVNGQDWVHVLDNGSTVGVNHLAQNPERIWSDMSAIDPKNPTENLRYQVYTEINQNAVDYMKKFISTTNGVKDISFVFQEGNILLVNWKQTNNDSYYKDVLIYRIQNADGKTWGPYEEAIDIPAKLGACYLPYRDEWVGRKIQVCICSVNGSFDDSQLDAIIGDSINQSKKTMANASVWVAKEDTIKRPLPIPVVHVEVGAFDRNGESDPYKLVAILDNYEEFERFYEENAGDKSLVKNVRIVVTFASGSTGTADQRDIKLSEGTRSLGFTASANADTYMGAFAKDINNTYAPSETANREFSFVGTVSSSASSFTKNDMTVTAFKDFYGNQTDNMYYELTLKRGDAKRTEFYVFSDLMIQDWSIADDLKVDMVISQGITHVTHGSDDEIACRLSNLPKNIFEYDLQVRTYLWYSQAEVMWFGHMVRTGIEEKALADTLKDAGLVDSERGNAPVLSDGKLNPGYVVRKNADGTYDVYYSVLLGSLDNDGNEIYVKQIDRKDYSARENVEATVSKITMVQKPVIDSFVLGENAQNQDTYTFTWDQENENYKAGSYALKFYGIKEETDAVSGKLVETEVLLDSRSVIGQGSVTYVDENRLWEYEEVRLEVERIGSADGSNKTTAFPRFGEYTAKVNLRHSQIAQPTVALNREGGVIEKESLKYKVVWIPIEASECDLVPAYEITVQPKADYVKNLGTVSHENYQEEVWNFIKVYADKAKDTRDLGTKDMVENAGNISFEWNETGSDGEAYTVRKEVKIQYSYIDGVGKILVNLVEDWRFEQPAGTSLSEAIIHLDDYARGEVVDISVRAKGAKKDIGSGECIHRDSLPGVAREITIPNRLYAPKAEKLTLLTELAEKNQILGQYYNGTAVTLPIVPEIFTETQFKNAYFRLNYSDTTEEDLQTAVHVSADINDLPPTMENLSGNSALITRDSETAMQGNFAQAEYRFGALAMKDFAGRYLRVALKGVSDSQISSLWSDEDSILENTTDYALFRLPKVKIDNPDVTEGEVMIYYDAQDDWHLTEASGSRSAKQPTLSFKWDELAKEYVIKRIRRNVTDSYGNKTDVDVIHMTMDESGHIQVTCISSGASKEFYAGSWSEDFDSANEIKLPWSESVQIDVAGNRSVASMLLTYQADTKTVTMILPDALELSAMAGSALDENLLTDQVYVQAIAGKENEEFFVDSQITTWKRNAGDRTNTTIGLLDAFDEAPDTIPTANVSVSEKTGIAYELEVTDTTNLYQITLKCADGKNAVRYLVPYQTLTGAWLLLTDELFAGFNPQLGEADNTVSYKVAKISENGVSAFTEENSPEFTLPKLTVSAGLLEAATDEGLDLPGAYQIAGAGEWKSITLAKQSRKLVPGSTEKISGYNIANGSGMNVEVRFHKADTIGDQTGWYVGDKLITDTEEDVALLYGTIVTTVSGNEGDTDKTFKTSVRMKCDSDGNLYVITPAASANGIITVETVGENTDYQCVYDVSFDVELSVTTTPLNENYRVN